MKPQIEFTHVLGELSVNRNDPCEIVRELISNSYDAGAKHILIAPLDDLDGLIFLDDGSGLDHVAQKNGITPWEAFFSIGKSTKNKGVGIGYKCQGSKLCFASKRILVATKLLNKKEDLWIYKIIDNPRNNLDTEFSIDPEQTPDLMSVISSFVGSADANAKKALKELSERLPSGDYATGTLILIDGLDTENFGKYFSVVPAVDSSYLYNYIRFYTRHGDVRKISVKQGFSPSQVAQVSSPTEATLLLYSAQQGSVEVPFGFPYLDKIDSKDEVKSPSQISRLRDGRFYARTAKTFSVGGKKYSIIFCVDGNRRAHEEYSSLDRKGKARSGVRLSDHRGVFISVKGIKICRYSDLLSSIDEYSVLTEGESYSHFLMILEGDFDLVTNRNALSKKAYDDLADPEFVKKVREFLDLFKSKDSVFSELLSRLRRESSENLLNEQIAMLKDSKERLKKRARLRFTDANHKKHLLLAPLPGEEYLVGVLYASLANFVPPGSPQAGFWKQVITFSTQGIDSLSIRDTGAASPLSAENIDSVEYKYDFNNSGPFNHALAVVNYIVAWDVNLNLAEKIRDAYTCFGRVRSGSESYIWEIYDIENEEAGEYPGVIQVINLKDLIEATFGAKFVDP